MCGITGFASTIRRDEWRAELGAAVRSLTHRGPDDEGVWTDSVAGLAHRRLSILDLSSGGHQPMASHSGRYVMVYNGEIYNFSQVRSELELQGEVFTSTSDSEVILSAVEAWGIQSAIERFIGMFAIALWDHHERRLLLIRDRLGVKPLYYVASADNQSLCFASELKALREFRHWHVECDIEALGEYFKFGYIGAPRTIYRGVRKLRPGHWIEFRPGTAPVVHRYWSILDRVRDPLTGTEDELAEQLEHLMLDAFRLRMVSDVPVGVFLSGGVDSSLVTALLRKQFSNLRTFTIGFKESEFDESHHARSVAKYLDTTHTESVISINDARDVLPAWSQLYDEPFADASGIPTYLVSKLASRHVKVALSADGGDELFSGYELHARALSLEDQRTRLGPTGRAVLNSLPLKTIDEGLATARRATPARRRLGERFTRRAARMQEYLGAHSFGTLYESLLSVWRPDEILLESSGTRFRPLADDYPGDAAERMCFWDLENYLPGDILAKVDRAAMAVSLEGREPLIDHRLVEFAFRLPLSMRRGSLGPKHILKRVLYKHVPRALVDRPKRGFAVPIKKWLEGDLAPLVDQYLDPGAIRRQGLLDVRAVSRAVEAFQSGGASDIRSTNRVWYVLAFQMWREQWL
ncbi:MAG: asparagine synthase (glutamine-hydrolyzing) [Deltaproteobacteria bacterium]|nr:asparagine synthase (glutamine-hydrolyzing) [Deltaproteobacteria bacterium]